MIYCDKGNFCSISIILSSSCLALGLIKSLVHFSFLNLCHFGITLYLLTGKLSKGGNVGKHKGRRGGGEREEEARVGCERALGLSEDLDASLLHLQTCVILAEPLSLLVLFPHLQSWREMSVKVVY